MFKIRIFQSKYPVGLPEVILKEEAEGLKEGAEGQVKMFVKNVPKP